MTSKNRVTRLVSAGLAVVTAFAGIVARPVTVRAAVLDYVDGEVIVTLSPGSNIDSINAELGSTTINQVGNTFRLQLPAKLKPRKAAKRLAREASVLTAGPNTFVTSPSAKRRPGRTAPLTFPNDLIDPGSLTTNPSNFLGDQPFKEKLHLNQAQTIARGEQITVAVIDTGVDLDHPYLANSIVRDASGNVVGADFVDGGLPDDDLRGYTGETPGLDVASAAYGHGTFIAGLVLQAAPAAKIMPVRVMGPDGVGTTFAVIEGVHFALEHGADVINLSLGAPDKILEGLDKELQEAREQAVVIAAVGNDDSIGNPLYPSKESSVLAVAAVTNADEKAVFSNYGSHVDVAAPGVSLWSTYPGGRFGTWSGTSFSAALVSGTAAIVASYADGRLKPDEIVDAIEDSADERLDEVRGNREYRGKIGEGLLDAAEALVVAADDID